MNKTTSTLITILITTIIAGGGVYIWQNNNTNTITDETTEEIEIVEEIPEEAIEETSEDLTYENDYFGFSLTFPTEWANYSVKNEAENIWFGFEAQESIFLISIHTIEEWETLPENQPNPSYLGENNGLVFAGSASHDSADDFTAERRFEVTSIMDTFTIIK